ncbi:MAG: cytochrome c peroxidase [Verrucomicrobiales bacterium]|jgi:cytochrome c peroxidase
MKDHRTKAAILASLLMATSGFAGDDDSGQEASIGRHIFLDTGLSAPVGQACVSCHNPKYAFADSRRVSPGAVDGRVGRRNAPTLMYAALIPPIVLEEFYDENGVESFAKEGGLFHDGRAHDQFAQVSQPFFEPDEMNLPDAAALAARLREAAYADEMKQLVGEEAWLDDGRLNYHAFRSLVEFLKEPLFRPFDARIDDYLAGDEKALSKSELRGLEVFKGAGKCAECHLLGTLNWPEPLLSDYGYDNVGAPSRGKKDPGLGGHSKVPEELGQFRAPTLRNVALTAPYLHNGSIGTLKEVMEFYNKRDLEPQRWGATDYPETVNHDDMGNLELTDQQVADLTALMDAFTDRSLLKMTDGQLFPEVPDDVPSSVSMKYYFPDWTHRLDPAFPREK